MTSIQLLRNARTVANDPDLPIANRPMSDDQRKAMFAGARGGRGGGGSGGLGPGPAPRPPSPQPQPRRHTVRIHPDTGQVIGGGSGGFNRHSGINEIAHLAWGGGPLNPDSPTNSAPRQDAMEVPAHEQMSQAEWARITREQQQRMGHLPSGIWDQSTQQWLDSQTGQPMVTGAGPGQYLVGHPRFHGTTATGLMMSQAQAQARARAQAGGTVGVMGGPGYQPGDRWNHSAGRWESPSGVPRGTPGSEWGINPPGGPSVPTQPGFGPPNRFPTSLPIEGERWSEPTGEFWPGTRIPKHTIHQIGGNNNARARINRNPTPILGVGDQRHPAQFQHPNPYVGFRQQTNQLMDAGARPVSSTREGMWFNVPGQGMTLVPVGR